jgi:hypothetical protein
MLMTTRAYIQTGLYNVDDNIAAGNYTVGIDDQGAFTCQARCLELLDGIQDYMFM